MTVFLYFEHRKKYFCVKGKISKDYFNTDKGFTNNNELNKS